MVCQPGCFVHVGFLIFSVPSGCPKIYLPFSITQRCRLGFPSFSTFLCFARANMVSAWLLHKSCLTQGSRSLAQGGGRLVRSAWRALNATLAARGPEAWVVFTVDGRRCKSRCKERSRLSFSPGRLGEEIRGQFLRLRTGRCSCVAQPNKSEQIALMESTSPMTFIQSHGGRY